MAVFRHFWPSLSPPPLRRKFNGRRIYGLTFKKHLALATASAVLFSTFIAPVEAFATPNCGGASWYALSSRTASGERMNASLMTAAHRSLQFGTKVKVTNRNNGKSVIVRINDRGPFIKGRVLDLSRAAAHEIGMVQSGTAHVCFQTVG